MYAGTRHVRIPAVLSSRDTEDMEHLYLDALVSTVWDKKQCVILHDNIQS